jgi:hypothetical protein
LAREKTKFPKSEAKAKQWIAYDGVLITSLLTKRKIRETGSRNPALKHSRLVATIFQLYRGGQFYW